MELTEACGCTAIQQFNFSFSPAFFPVLKSISHWLCACQSPPSLLLSVKNWRVWNLYLKASKLICHRLIDSGRRHKTPRSKTECSYLWPSGQQELHVHRDVSCSPNPTGWYRTQTGLHHSQRTLSLGNPSSLSDSPGKPTQALPWRKTLSLLYWREISLFCISTGDIISISQNCLLDEHPQKDALKLSVSLQKYKRPLEKFLSAISTSHFYTVWTSG